MQAPDMSAFRSLYLCKTLRILSTQNPTIITCYESRRFRRVSKKFHSTPHPRFPSSTAANESTVPSWSSFPNSPPPPVDSVPRQTPTVQTVYDPTTGSVVTKREHNDSKEFDSGAEKTENISSSGSNFPNSPPTPPVGSLPRQSPTLQTVYYPATGRTVTKREHDSSKELDSGTEKAENVSRSWSAFPNLPPRPPSSPVDSLPSQNPTVQTVHDLNTGSAVTKREHNSSKELDPGTEKAEDISSRWSAFPNLPPPPPVDSLPPQTPTVQTVLDPTTGRVVTKQEHNGSKELASGTEKDENISSSWSAFPNSPPPPVRVDSLPRHTPTVQTIYDPTTGHVVTKREHNGSKELHSGTEKAEKRSSSSVRSRVNADISSTERGSRVYENVIRSSSVSKTGKKSKSVYVCSNCGYSDGQWWGTCKQCEEVGTMTRFTTESANQKTSGMQVSENAVRSWLPKEASPIKLTDVFSRINDTKWRMPLTGQFGAEVDMVLGGGLVPGSLVLVGGDPGVGKSTLLLQIAALLGEGNDADGPGPVIYVSGEESVEQIANRADRLCIETENLFLYSSTDIEEIIEQAQRLSPKVLVIDSIQTVYLKEVTGSAGGLSQVKECTSALLKFAKKTNIPVLLIGHVTKTGEIAGPRVLEHIVDVVLYLEGEKHSSHRLLRSVKNRFGPTDELGVFKMSQLGLEEVLNPSEMYLAEQHSDSDYPAGLAVTVILDGSRAFLIEVQALCGAGSSAERSGSLGVRHLNGVQASRADMIISVMIKQAGLKLQVNDIFLNVVNGVSLTETAGDLSIAAAICSSFLEFPLPNGIAFIAEIGLAGELRMVPQLEKRINTLGKLGYKKCIVPKSAEKSLPDLQPDGMEIVGCKNLKDMINAVFRIS